ncbi:MAG: family 78 glycoside hydrolase catalytic domain [bacterium]|jgi:alpha-L-rhamnosidase
MQTYNLTPEEKSASVPWDLALDRASWIWRQEDQSLPHQYICFRKTFSLEKVPGKAILAIAADSDFILYINGAEAGRGQFSDYPERKTYTELQVRKFLKKGVNLISVLAYYRGCDSHEYRSGRPGLLLALAGEAGTILVSDTSWKVLQHPAFRHGEMPKVTSQMGFTACFDARLDIPWTKNSFDDKEWPQAIVTNEAGQGPELSLRPVPPLKIKRVSATHITAYGYVMRRQKEEGTFAEIMARDVLKRQRLPELKERALILDIPPAGVDGHYLIIDLMREEVGLLSFSIEASEGTVLDIAHGEHLQDGRVRARIGVRNFADRYICRQGLNKFTLPFRRLGARYLEVHITGMTAPLSFHIMGLKPAELELDVRGSFYTHDETAVKTYNVGRRTLQLCMHEHFEDCPWREQALYAFDSRNQALYGYYAFGNYDFAGVSFDLLGRGIRSDGLLELCAPARVPVNIPSFSLVWITALAEHMLYSGRKELFARYQEQMDFMLEKLFAGLDCATKLYRLPTGNGIWHFYDWQNGLDGYSGDFPREDTDRFDAPYNLFLYEALNAYVWMLEQSGQEEKAAGIAVRRDELGEAINRSFWDNDRGLLSTYLISGRRYHFSELVQCQAVHADILSVEQIPGILDHLLEEREKNLIPVTLSSMLYKVLAFNSLGEKARSAIAREVSEIWGQMLAAGATTFWETSDGAEAFEGAGSLCHGWSALPVYYYQSWVLGIRPLQPGYGSFAVSPFPGGMTSASGKIPTPAGDIKIEWRQKEGGLVIEAFGPTELRPRLMSLPEAPVKEACYNRVLLTRHKER